MKNIFSFSANNLAGQAIPLETYQNQVLLIVNTASHCGFTPQYQALEKLYRSYKQQGFSVLAFPCNQFGNQEPGNSDAIAAFCQQHYQVSFPIFEKIDVNGNNSHPIYQYLKTSAPGIFGTTDIKWNFTKFLLARDGSVYKRYAPFTPPQALAKEIEHLLQG